MIDFLFHMRPLEILILGQFVLIFLAFFAFGISALKSRSGRSSVDDRPFGMAVQNSAGQIGPSSINVASALPTENYGCQVNSISLSRSLLD
ncbi:hypothetical protein HUE56_29735 (plasmid) [Azospirillum oryzae]|uniref:Uncharacterized protein n=1 Tax=Azospirillum oryzae TaxID=286727 RepID=A0A6N1ASA3_9PROT|nr:MULTISPECIES: hypothetical protein [Azospirillum]KAA0584742.1 hypothetical protein FZ938_28530 [Azospirillum oryzae]PWC84348.1 hypothetical protein TSO5_27970 [Azospirillum sp. TSO5]QCG99228.1 hypothetical protein E6C67_36180 [Azospirillum sp. TSA2s]QKS54685.1 hypothetical protein HUE56_29735 [Azospirillum oryzae]GLR77575.1 hypothetical protein GCM10007856_02430 [Azospirillum oryzae]